MQSKRGNRAGRGKPGTLAAVPQRYGGFDRLAASAVKEAKRFYPEVKLTLLLPYHPAEHPFPKPESFDDSFYPPNMEHVPRRLAIIRANQYMVNNSTHLIAYVKRPSNGSREVLEAALKRQKRGLMHVINLGGWYPL